jgi:hypothetical protein
LLGVPYHRVPGFGSTLADTSGAEGPAMIVLNVAALILLTHAILPNLLEHTWARSQYRIGAGPHLSGTRLAQQNIVPTEGLVDAGETICLPHGLP